MDLVPGFHVLTRQACTLSAGSANPKSRRTAAMDPQSTNFPAHGDNDCDGTTSAASAEMGAADPRESRHSRNGQRQVQWRTTSPLARHVLQGPTGSSVVLTHSPFWISKNSAPSMYLKRRLMTFFSRIPASLSPGSRRISSPDCGPEVEDVPDFPSYLCLYVLADE